MAIARYTLSAPLSPTFLECFFSFRALYNVPYRLFYLPPLYRSLGIRDPYFGRPPLSQPEIPLLEMSLTSSEGSGSSGSGSEGSGSQESSSVRSILPPSVFDRDSHGEIPGQPLGEAGEGLAEVVASRSRGEVSVSGSAETELCSRGIFSVLVASDLDRIRTKFGIPSEVSLVVPSGEASRHQSGFLTLCEDAL